MKRSRHDIEVQSGGSVGLVIPRTAAGRSWVDENLHAERWRWIGGALAVESRYAPDLTELMRDDGLMVLAD